MKESLHKLNVLNWFLREAGVVRKRAAEEERRRRKKRDEFVEAIRSECKHERAVYAIFPDTAPRLVGVDSHTHIVCVSCGHCVKWADRSREVGIRKRIQLSEFEEIEKSLREKGLLERKK